MKPLEAIIRAEVTSGGPMKLDRYMGLALAHPEHGYYMIRDPLGASGDFITAPEISQMFGELIGLWLADMWRRLGLPEDIIIVEAGPGRGTLMADALRAMRRAAPDLAARPVWLVETSPALKQIQAERLQGFDVNWAASLYDVPDAPLLLVANEFFDALPVAQLVQRAEGLMEICVGVDGDALAFVERKPDGELPKGLPPLQPGEIIEFAPEREMAADTIAMQIADKGGAALLIDYGHEITVPGDTLQAMQAHAAHPVLEAPGTADLTSHVDFAALGRAAEREGVAIFGPIGQRQFLLRLGMEARLAQLMKGADDQTANGLATGFRRLTDPAHMGHLFKVLCLSPSSLGAPTGFVDAEAFRTLD